MDGPVRIGCYSAFWGDSPWAAKQFLQATGSQVDYVVADYLAELTMGLLARSFRAKSSSGRPKNGYISEFLELVLAPNLDQIVEKKIRIVTNAGGLDPVGLKNAIEVYLAKHGNANALKIAAVVGDDILEERKSLEAKNAFERFDPLSGAGAREDGLQSRKDLLSLNAYLGAAGITEALRDGADIVVTGRVVDSALVVGPLAYEYNWNYGTDQQSLDQLASASLAGHIVECGCQATGGNYTDWRASAASPHGGWANMGYPILAFYPSLDFTISKAENTGGIVNAQSVCEQMLYEVLDPENYALPDVVLDMTQVRIDQQETGSVRVSGAKGRPPTPWLKCTAIEQKGFKTSVDILVCGEESESKAKALGRAIIERTNDIAKAHDAEASPIGPSDHEIVLIGAESSLGAARTMPERREIALRVAARHQSQAVLSILAKDAASFLTNSCPGICLLTSGRPAISPNFVASSVLVRREELRPSIHVSGQQEKAVPISSGGCKIIQPSSSCVQAKRGSNRARGATKLLDVAIGRSGDKGDNANVAIIARKPAFYPILLDQLTPDVIFETFKHFLGPGASVSRFEVPGVYAVNFVLTKALGGGGLSSLRLDRQAKSYAQIALSSICLDVLADVGLDARL